MAISARRWRRSDVRDRWCVRIGVSVKDIVSSAIFHWYAYKRVTNLHYSDVIMGTVASQITSLTIVYSTVYSGAAQRKHQSSASLAFVWGIHRWPVDSPYKWPVTRKMFPFDDVIMSFGRPWHPSGGILQSMRLITLWCAKLIYRLTKTMVPALDWYEKCSLRNTSYIRKFIVLNIKKLTNRELCKGLICESAMSISSAIRIVN